MKSDIPDSDRRPLLALMAGVVGIGFAPVLGKLAVELDDVSALEEPLSPSAVAFWRMLLALPVFFWMARRSADLRVRSASNRLTWLSLAVPGFLFALDIGPWHWSFQYTTVANATLLANLAVVVVTLVAWIWFKERPHWTFFLGAMIALLGTAGLVGAGLSVRPEALLGDLIAAFCALAYAGYLLTTKRLLRTWNASVVMLASTAGCALFLLLGSLMAPGRILPSRPETWLCVIALAFISQVMGQGLIAWSMSRLPVTFATVTLIAQPVLATILGWLILDQSLTPAALAFGVVSMAGVWLAAKGSQGATAARQNLASVSEP